MEANISFDLSSSSIKLETGVTSSVTASIRNGTGVPQEFSLVFKGLNRKWVNYQPQIISLAVGQTAQVVISITLPSQFPAGNTPVELQLHRRGQRTPLVSQPLFLEVRAGMDSSTTDDNRPDLKKFLIPGGIAAVILALGLVLAIAHPWAQNTNPTPTTQPTGTAYGAKCGSGATVLATLFGDDKTTAIRLSKADQSQMQVLRTEPADVLPGLYDSLLSLTPDNKRLAYVTAKNQFMDDTHLYYIDVATPDKRIELAAIPTGFWMVQPAWSPDGQQLAFLKLNDAMAATGQTQLELWVASTSGQAPRLVAVPPQLKPEIFMGNPSTPLCWAQDNKTLIFSNTSGVSQTSSTQTEVNTQTGETLVTERPPQPVPIQRDEILPPGAVQGSPCGVPAMSQNDPRWRSIMMKTGGDRIGEAGCALTSTAMVFNYFGAPITPDQLNSCLGNAADPIYWTTATGCSSGKVTGGNRPGWSWQALNDVLATGYPAIVGMLRGQNGMHFVVVTSGGGSNAANFAVTDPWDASTNKTLQYFFNVGYNPAWVVSYSGAGKNCNRQIPDEAIKVGGVEDGGVYTSPVTLGEITGNTSEVTDSTITNVSTDGSASVPVTTTTSPTTTGVITTTPAITTTSPGITTTTGPIISGKPLTLFPTRIPLPVTKGPFPVVCKVGERCYLDITNEPLRGISFKPGTVIQQDGVYQITVRTQSKTTRLKFTLDRTPPRLCVGLLGLGSAGNCSQGALNNDLFSSGYQNPAPVTTTASQGIIKLENNSVRPQLLTQTTKPQVVGSARLIALSDDTLSGVAAIKYRLDGSDWQYYSNDTTFKLPLVVTAPGDHSIIFQALDLAGNTTTLDTFEFSIISQNGETPVSPTPVPSDTPAPTGTPVPSPGSTPANVPEQIKVPALVNLSLEEASRQLKSLQLSIGQVTEQYDDKIAQGKVISQNPASAVLVGPGTSVNLVISKGPRPVLVIDVTKQPLETARKMLDNIGLAVGTVTIQESSVISEGVVISQDPLVGKQVPVGTTINLIVSGGVFYPVPDLTNQNLDVARRMIKDSRFTLGQVTQQPSSTVKAGYVISQNLSAGTRSKAGTAIDLVVSSGPPPVKVPLITGLPYERATVLIKSAGFVVGKVTYQYSSTIARGNVMDQSPAADSLQPPGSAIDLVVSQGPKMAATPNLIGLSLTQATAKIKEVGLTLGKVTYQCVNNSLSFRSGVTSQSYPAGTSVPEGTAIDITVLNDPDACAIN